MLCIARHCKNYESKIISKSFPAHFNVNPHPLWAALLHLLSLALSLPTHFLISLCLRLPRQQHQHMWPAHSKVAAILLYGFQENSRTMVQHTTTTGDNTCARCTVRSHESVERCNGDTTTADNSGASKATTASFSTAITIANAMFKSH